MVMSLIEVIPLPKAFAFTQPDLSEYMPYYMKRLKEVVLANYWMFNKLEVVKAQQ